MLWFWGFCLALSIVVLAGRAHSRYLNRLDRENDEAWYVVLSGRNNPMGSPVMAGNSGSSYLLLTPASPMTANAVTLGFAQSDLSTKQGRVHLAADLHFKNTSGPA